MAAMTPTDAREFLRRWNKVERVRQRWMREFAQATAASDLVEDFERALARRK